VSFGNRSSESHKGWKAKVKITIQGEDKERLRGATVTVAMTRAKGESKTWTYKIRNKSGKETLSWSGLDRRDFAVKLTVDSVVYEGEKYEPETNSYPIKT
jgi:hypothetical protein